MPWKPSFEGERPTLGWYVLDWIEEFLIVPDGPSAGEPLVFTNEQAQFVLKFYEVDRRFSGQAIRGRSMMNGRLIRRAVLSRPKGWGKSPLVAALCLVEALGDVVLDGWDADGQPVGKPWADLGFKPKVQVVAVSEDQTTNTWEPLLDMASTGPVYDAYQIEPLQGFVNVPRGVIEPVTASGTSREGFRPVFNAMDQTESWKPSNGGVKLAATLRRNLAKVNGSSVETPNAFRPGEDSVAEHSFDAERLQAEGKTKISTGVLFDHREAPPETDPTDEASLRHGLAVAYGESADVNGGWVSIDRIVADYWDPDTDPQDARGFYLNQITHASDSWLTQPEWAHVADATKVVADLEQITLGFDGSRGRAKGKPDATALIACRVSDGHLFELGVWEAPDGPGQDEWQPPMAAIEAAIQHAFTKYTVVGAYMDGEGLAFPRQPVGSDLRRSGHGEVDRRPSVRVVDDRRQVRQGPSGDRVVRGRCSQRRSVPLRRVRPHPPRSPSPAPGQGREAQPRQRERLLTPQDRRSGGRCSRLAVPARRRGQGRRDASG